MTAAPRRPARGPCTRRAGPPADPLPSRRRAQAALAGSAQRRGGVVVDARGGELAAVAADVDGEARFRPQLRPAPGDDVVLQRACAAVVGDDAPLQPDAAAIGEEQLIERAQLAGPAVEIRIAGGLAH